jgi:hypothetical protein
MTLPPKLYDLVQVVLGMRISQAKLGPFFAEMENARVIDVGGGTALHGRLLPTSASYLCLDLDIEKLERAHMSGARALQCDATQIPLATKSVDYAMCIAFAHHLSDVALTTALREIARVVRRKLIFLDPLAQDRLSFPWLLWKLDAGSHPRSEQQLLAAISDVFTCDYVESYAIYHRYLMCIASPLKTLPGVTD